MYEEIKGIAGLLAFLCVLVSVALGYLNNDVTGMFLGGIFGFLVAIPEYVLLVSYAQLCEDIHIIRVNSQRRTNTQQDKFENESR